LYIPTWQSRTLKKNKNKNQSSNNPFKLYENLHLLRTSKFGTNILVGIKRKKNHFDV
jgi:hypothetical protein